MCTCTSCMLSAAPTVFLAAARAKGGYAAAYLTDPGSISILDSCRTVLDTRVFYKHESLMQLQHYETCNISAHAPQLYLAAHMLHIKPLSGSHVRHFLSDGALARIVHLRGVAVLLALGNPGFPQGWQTLPRVMPLHN